jgi:hypothetical protein
MRVVYSSQKDNHHKINHKITFNKLNKKVLNKY